MTEAQQANLTAFRDAPDGFLHVRPEPAALSVRPEPAALNPLALLQTAIEKGMNPDQLTRLFDMAERWEKSRAAERFAAAITAFQAECPVVRKRRKAGKDDSKFGTYMFANHEDVNAAAGPALARHGIVVSFVTEHQENAARLKIVCRLRVGTHTEDTPFTIPIPVMTVSETQKYGAALSYGKRYAMCAALNIVVADEDNDAGKLLEFVNEEELAQLKKMAAERDVNVPVFMKVLKIASDDLADVPRDRFAHAVQIMKDKRPVTKKPEEAAK